MPHTKPHNTYCFRQPQPAARCGAAAAERPRADDCFGYACFDPPYGFALGKSPAQQGRFFLDFCTLLFGRRLDQIEVYAWNTGCSDYFDDGREWRGTYFWTVKSRGYGTDVSITGSATD